MTKDMKSEKVLDSTKSLPTVVNIRTQKCDLYIGRVSIWGNPFLIGRHGTREEVIQKYEVWVRNQPDLMEKVKTLLGKTLGCYCSPEPCHGDILKKLCQEYLDSLK